MSDLQELRRKAALWDAISMLWHFPGKTLEQVLEQVAKDLANKQKAATFAISATALIPDGACPECRGAGEFESALHNEQCGACGGTGKAVSPPL